MVQLCDGKGRAGVILATTITTALVSCISIALVADSILLMQLMLLVLLMLLLLSLFPLVSLHLRFLGLLLPCYFYCTTATTLLYYMLWTKCDFRAKAVEAQFFSVNLIKAMTSGHIVVETHVFSTDPIKKLWLSSLSRKSPFRYCRFYPKNNVSRTPKHGAVEVHVFTANKSGLGRRTSFLCRKSYQKL